ncbi:MAG: hypothetical protein ABIT07_01500 [Ferruginibacter sp.]
MKNIIYNIFYSFPVQLFILHFRKYQVLLIFWYLLFSTINSGFLKIFGADALFFSPEYLGTVNIIGNLITGMALGIFMMSWNITSFILHSKRFKFLATTSNPFLKYCINNSVLPLIFLFFYFIKLYQFNIYKELMSPNEIFAELGGLLLGFIVVLSLSFGYFFGAEKTIAHTLAPIILNPELFKEKFKEKSLVVDEFGLKVKYYLNANFGIRKVRNVQHYRSDYLDTVFKRHHLAAIASIVLAFIFLVTIGFSLENRYFEMPAAASILIFFALMIAFIGALSYFLESWSLPAAIILLFVINILFKMEIIDPRNKAYGLDYKSKAGRPGYTKADLNALCTSEKLLADKTNMINILDKWKAKQRQLKPLMVFINVSGGGLRSSAFVMNGLQQLDSICQGRLLSHTFLISGASGGMMAATYYRELYRNKLRNNSINLHDPRYTDYIAGDLLNPIFTSLMARDLLAPFQKFSVDNEYFVKDRGYAFEKKLSDNTRGLLNVQLKDLLKDESNADVPLIFFNSVIKSDGRKMIISTQPISFMMKPVSLQQDTATSPDAVDFSAIFKNKRPLNLRVLTALRMNATFPYVLPNVWLPSNPVIDVMDAGLRDNFGPETTLRFIDNFREWIKQNTSGVMIIQFRDRPVDNWGQPFETNSLADLVVTPGTMLQHNWYKLQDYAQSDVFNYFKSNQDSTFYKISINYTSSKEEKTAALNFHLTAREKRDVKESFFNNLNAAAVKQVANLLNH